MQSAHPKNTNWLGFAEATTRESFVLMADSPSIARHRSPVQGVSASNSPEAQPERGEKNPADAANPPEDESSESPRQSPRRTLARLASGPSPKQTTPSARREPLAARRSTPPGERIPGCRPSPGSSPAGGFAARWAGHARQGGVLRAGRSMAQPRNENGRFGLTRTTRSGIAKLDNKSGSVVRATLLPAICAVVLSIGCIAAPHIIWRRPDDSQDRAKQTASVQDDGMDRADVPAFKPLQSFHGQYSKINEEKLLRITTEREWRSIWAEHTGGIAEPVSEIKPDFHDQMVIAIFQGASGLCNGFEIESAIEKKDCIAIRVRALTFQFNLSSDSDANAINSQAWGIFILPRSDKKVLVERDQQIEFSEPPQWVRWKTFPAISKNQP